jgi:hypothetical protein
MLTYAAVAGGIEQIIRNVMRPHRMLTYAMFMLTYAHADAAVADGIERDVADHPKRHALS